MGTPAVLPSGYSVDINQRTGLPFLRKDSNQNSDALNVFQEKQSPLESTPRVFICHAREDARAASEVYSWMRESGCDPWLDKHDLLPGQTWEQEIERIIPKMHAFVALLSQKSVTKSGFVQKEVRLALDVMERQPPGKIFLIPVRLEDVSIPARIQPFHAVDWHDFEGRTQLRASLQIIADNIENES
ncbi:MAG: toll/interleukin-1 receptor domain-containing protein [Thermoplasmatota archaeon]